MKQATITINGATIEIRELTVRQICQFQAEVSTDTLEAIKVIAARVTTATEEQLLDMTPSQLLELWGTVKEVNAAFFDLTRFEEILTGLRDRLITMYSGVLSAVLSARATDPEPGSIPGLSSSPPSTASESTSATP